MTTPPVRPDVRRRRAWHKRTGAILLLGSCCGGFPIAMSAGATATGVVTGSLAVAVGVPAVAWLRRS